MQSLLYELKGVNIFNSRNQRLIILAYLESTIKLAESLTDIYEVYIFVNINEVDEIKYNGVSYLNLFP